MTLALTLAFLAFWLGCRIGARRGRLEQLRATDWFAGSALGWHVGQAIGGYIDPQLTPIDPTGGNDGKPTIH